MNHIQQQYQSWLEHTAQDKELQEELSRLAASPAQLQDAFYKELSFGTGGLRGLLGAGTNRMNVHTVGKASQGLADYIIKNFPPEKRRLAISYDSRLNSTLFAQVTAEVFAANGLQVFIEPQLMPTPCLSFAVRQLQCAGGVMITASHNPARYNGYKVYGPDGCQITTQAAAEILQEIKKLDIFTQVRRLPFDRAQASGQIKPVPQEVHTAFIQAVKAQSVLAGEAADKTISIVYSPLNGTGLLPVTRVLHESGFSRITLVKEQEKPDGNFPTCPYPNPELEQAMSLALNYAQKYNADLVLATDPDCDRVGVAVPNANGRYQLLSGNETGMLLLDYICSRRRALSRMPARPVFIKTIVTSNLLEKIAADYGVQTVNVLTGFKFIGEQIGALEKQGRVEDYIFGCEESCGYLSGSYVRDKDGVNAAFLISEMCAYYRARGKSLWTQLEQLYTRYGYCLSTLHAYEFTGPGGEAKIQAVMAAFAQTDRSTGLARWPLVSKTDYRPGINGLPPAQVLAFTLQDDVSVIVRPSGTEPKLKIYISATAVSRQETRQKEQQLLHALEQHIIHP